MNGFHIHVDAIWLTEQAERWLATAVGFARTDFCGHPAGAPAYEPAHHLTGKLKSAADYRAAFDRVREHMSAEGSMRGYLEGEFVALDQDLAERPFDPVVPIPFRLSAAPLPPGRFRESEIHVVMARDASHPDLLRALSEMGLFAAYVPKPYGVAQIFTAQGTRTQIHSLLPPLLAYLERAGGAARCSVKEERVVDSWLSHPNVPLPPVVAEVSWPGRQG